MIVIFYYRPNGASERGRGESRRLVCGWWETQPQRDRRRGQAICAEIVGRARCARARGARKRQDIAGARLSSRFIGWSAWLLRRGGYQSARALRLARWMRVIHGPFINGRAPRQMPTAARWNAQSFRADVPNIQISTGRFRISYFWSI